MDWQVLLSVAPFDWASIGTALASGGVIGLERQLRGKPVGIRTSILIVLGTYIFITASMSVSSHMTDPSRIIGQVITGVGFLGAGVMLARKGVVLGVTSAAAIWVLSAIGVCVAIGKLLVAFKFSLLVVFILAGVDLLEAYSQAFSRGVYQHVRSLIGKSQKYDDD
ncbi:MgtC/SapB family protein [Simiduia aestuariiviva]|uniref:Protein MgtC n=1 Tax=Simiduia aestuariiviva TaxID=1510459 RepID=A0A839UM46_9GAMM|nr:MgtC/SapB family protein [Simiduia aestuariiviva]MBB3169264.1 putative Mg2+ transporter-C (MgtC) family protein [Simiduia aestuariiviva]